MNPDNLFMGKSVAVTGRLENYTRDGIKARLLELGAKPVSKVSKRTDYLILGRGPAISWLRLWLWESVSCLSRNLSV